MKLRITPFLVTLATLVAGRGLGTAITESFGIQFPASFLQFGASSVLGVPMPIIVFAIVVAVAHLVLTRTQFGRQVYAVGQRPGGRPEGGHPRRPGHVLGLRHLRHVRGDRRRDAHRAHRPAEPDVRRGQGVRRHHRGRAGRHEPVRRRGLAPSEPSSARCWSRWRRRAWCSSASTSTSSRWCSR